jgi:hypothetical protein
MVLEIVKLRAFHMLDKCSAHRATASAPVVIKSHKLYYDTNPVICPLIFILFIIILIQSLSISYSDYSNYFLSNFSSLYLYSWMKVFS